MIICPSCNNPNDTVYKFCERCGTKLIVLRDTTPKANKAKPITHGTVLLKDDTLPYTIHFKLADGKTFSFKKTGDYHVGRFDAASEWYPAIDLTHHGGQPAGASRRHATITIAPTTITITDLNSSNGTKLNGEKLKAHQPSLLSNGDELLFGRLLARVIVER